MSHLNHFKDLYYALNNGAYIVTPNNRLALQLTEIFLQLHDQPTAIRPNCYPYPIFLQTLYKNLIHQNPRDKNPILLSSCQQHYLWREVIEAEYDNVPHSLVKEIEDIWSRCKEWNVCLDEFDFSYTPQTAQFRNWHKAFDIKLASLNAICSSQLSAYLIKNKRILLPFPRIIWLSFDSFNPSQKQLQLFFNELSIEQCFFDIPETKEQPLQYAAKEEHDETNQLIQWLKLQLAQKNQHIAVVVPNLEEQATGLRRKLAQFLEPDQFNLSLGNRLIDYPIIGHAIQWCLLDQSHLTHTQAELLLFSPFIKGANLEFQPRCDFLEHSLLLTQKQFSWDQWLSDIKENLPILFDTLISIDTYPEVATPVEWVRLFKKRLNEIGFPGGYALNSESYQCFQRFILLLDEFQQLNLIYKTLQQEEALAILAQLAAEILFQAQAANPAPIQILGLLEASGCIFDKVWLLGITDQCLPQKTKLSPWIPHQLQRDLQMPRALPEREIILASQFIHRLKNGCQQLIISHPKMIQDIPCLASPLIQHYAHFLPLDNEFNQDKALVEVIDSYQIPLSPIETIKGGTALLANQAKCPFRAFAAHRLFAEPCTELEIGYSSLVRGLSLHLIMEKLWRHLKSQDKLFSLSQGELESILNSILDQTIRAKTDLLAEVERMRLLHLLNQALDWEKERKPFEIAAIEENFEISLADIPFRVRVDRIDLLANGKKWIIDYKSSISTDKPWEDERPEAPQLLLYALLDEQINGVLFLALKANKINCHGLSSEDNELLGISTLDSEEEWQAYREKWRQSLENLAIEFKSGYCPPQPQKEATCQYCEFQDLCRLHVNV